jgi:hypothetical protein
MVTTGKTNGSDQFSIPSSQFSSEGNSFTREVPFG